MNPILDAFKRVDWMVRVNAPSWLRLVDLVDFAIQLEELPEITPKSFPIEVPHPKIQMLVDRVSFPVRQLWRGDEDDDARVASWTAGAAAFKASGGLAAWDEWDRLWTYMAGFSLLDVGSYSAKAAARLGGDLEANVASMQAHLD